MFTTDRVLDAAAHLLFFAVPALVLLCMLHAIRRRSGSRHSALLSGALWRSATRSEMQYLLTHDVLTSLPNRTLLEDRMRQAVCSAERRGARFATFVIDLDRFKSVNDSLGRESGDRLLVEVSRRLALLTRRTDTLARNGSNEFVLIVTDTARDGAIVVADKIAAAFAAPVPVGTNEIYVDASIGVSVYGEDSTDPDTLLIQADCAMTHAKKLGGRQVQQFATEMNACSRERFAFTNELRQSIPLQQLELHYQPKVDMHSGRIVGAEALVRWQHPLRGLLYPDAFLPLAEEAGLIVSISEWALVEACRQAAVWQRVLRMRMRVAVNLSSQQFHKSDLPEQVARALAASGLEPRYLRLELTEGALIQDPEQTAHTLRRLRAMGVALSIDDFGIGYSNLGYLKRFPIDELKIDRSFVAAMQSSAADASIVRALVRLAHDLGLTVVAEGVETMEQLQALEDLQCNQYQGYLCSKAVPADAFATLVYKSRRKGEVSHRERQAQEEWNRKLSTAQ